MTNPELFELKNNEMNKSQIIGMEEWNEDRPHEKKINNGEEELVAQSLLSFQNSEHVICHKSSLDFILNDSSQSCEMDENPIITEPDLKCSAHYYNGGNCNALIIREQENCKDPSKNALIQGFINQHASVSGTTLGDNYLLNGHYVHNSSSNSVRYLYRQYINQSRINSTSNQCENTISYSPSSDISSLQGNVQRPSYYTCTNSQYHNQFTTNSQHNNHARYTKPIFPGNTSNGISFSTYEECHFGHREPKLKRKRLNSHQIFVLESVFKETCFPSTELRNNLGLHLGLAPRTIQIWFQNKRQNSRNKIRGGFRHYEPLPLRQSQDDSTVGYPSFHHNQTNGFAKSEDINTQEIQDDVHILARPHIMTALGGRVGYTNPITYRAN